MFTVVFAAGAKEKVGIEDEIVAWVADRVEDHMRLRGGVRSIDQIPRNHGGKILRRALREKLAIKATA